ncbi:MAG: hypothetical protein WCA56_08965 [Xanthobacteraceae bacterium]|jgi:hypothetical protein
MRRAAVLAFIASAVVVLGPISGAMAASSSWTCQAASSGGASSGDGATRKEAEDSALANCAARSARFSICRAFNCRRVHRSY